MTRRAGGGGAEGLFDDDMFARMIATSPYARSAAERRRVLEIHGELQKGMPISSGDLGLYEGIVLPTGRPAWFVQDGRIVGDFTDLWSTFADRATRDLVERALPSIGRVELEGPTSLPYAGTAFVVGPGLLMTNRHVAKLFARGTGNRVRFVSGFGAGIDFVRERDRRATKRYPVSRVVMMHPYWDMALLSVEGLPVPALTLDPVAVEDRIGAQVAVAGYPTYDPRNPPDVQARVFSETYGVKRLQPGLILGRRSYLGDGRVVSALAHDASTLGGNSGSAVLDLQTGHVLGLHFGGEYAVANYAVPAIELARDARVRAAGVQFTRGVAEHPSPWEGSWAAADEAGGSALSPPRQSEPPPHRREGREITIPIEIDIRIKVERP